MANRHRIIIFLVLLFVLSATTAAFSPSLNNNFTNWDDPGHLLSNRSVRSLGLANVVSIFKNKGVVNGTYIPLTILSFAGEYHFFGYEPFIYHLDNLLLHLCVVALVYVFALQCGLSPIGAGAAALLFGVHPMHVESVAWVTERKDVLCGVFYMLALVSYMKYLKRRQAVYFIAAMASSFFGMLAKPMAVSLPFVLLVVDLLYGRKINFNALAEKGLLALCVFPAALVTYFLNLTIFSGEESLVKTAMVIVWGITFHLKQFVLPLALSPVYVFPEPVALSNPAHLLSFAIFVLALVLLFLFRKDKLLPFSFAFYFCSVFVLLRSHTEFNFTMASDRFMYLPSVGFCLLFGHILDGVRTNAASGGILKRTAVAGMAVFLFTWLSFTTYRLCGTWKDGVTFWSAVIKKVPGLGRAYYGRADAHEKKGEHALALADYTKALSVDPQKYKAFVNRGVIYHEMGSEDMAIKDYNAALGIVYEQVEVFRNKYNECLEKNEINKAYHYVELIEQKRKALGLIYSNRAVSFEKQGRHVQALKDALRAKDLGIKKIGQFIRTLKMTVDKRRM